MKTGSLTPALPTFVNTKTEVRWTLSIDSALYVLIRDESETDLRTKKYSIVPCVSELDSDRLLDCNPEK